MDPFSAKLNEVLVNTFRSILKVEEQTIKRSERMDLTITELHLLDTVSKSSGGRMVSDIAADLCITLPSVTVAINKLQKKGYVTKKRCDLDRRVVYVALTELGRKMNAVHRYFHESMVRAVTQGLSWKEKNAMLKGIHKLHAFFEKRLKALEKL